MMKKPESRLEKLAFLSTTSDLGRFDAPVSPEAVQLALSTMESAGSKYLIRDGVILREGIQHYSRALQTLEAYKNVSDEEIDQLLKAYEF